MNIVVKRHLKYVRLTKHYNDKNYCILHIQISILNLDQFFKLLGETLKNLYQPTFTFLLFGKFDINFLTENSDKQKLVTLMKTYNLTQVG